MYKPLCLRTICVAAVLTVVLFSCKKSFTSNEAELQDAMLSSSASSAALASTGTTGYCWEDAEDPNRYDTLPRQTILGAKLLGTPYSLTNMRQAYLNLTGSNSGVVANKKYMRFKPTGYDQVAVLSKLDIDLFDYPLDYELVQEGDYYNDGTTTGEQIPWLYAVVDVGFVPPSGITNELLQTIHVPDDYRIENEAFRLTGNSPDTATCTGGGVSQSLAKGVTPNSVPVCDCTGSPYDMTCECRTYCNVEPCATPLPPVPPTRIPGGQITVTDDVFNNKVGARKARLVARRFLKVDRTYTDNNGNYHFTKSFRNKFTLLIKFKNDNAMVNPMLKERGYQMLFPTKINWGRFRGNVNNIIKNVDDNNDVKKRGSLHWAAATTHNMVQEYINDRAPADGIGAPPSGMVIITSNGSGGSATPMFNKRTAAAVSTTYWKQVLIPFANLNYSISDVNLIAAVLTGRADMILKYGANSTTKSSDQMAEVGYHELTHAAHYNKVGGAWFDQFVRSEVAQIIDNYNGSKSPYGAKTSADAPIIAVGESWAYYMGHYLCYRKYGSLAGPFYEQGNPAYTKNWPIDNFYSNLNLLEDFNPNRTIDPFYWIPQGLFYDLLDNRNDNNATPRRILLDDIVSGYTNQQLFNALDADILTLPAYKTRLLSENGNSQAGGVNIIFTFYGY